jgi:hypothetical protein
MYPFLSFAHPKRAASGWCIFAGFIGGVMHIVSLSMVVLWLGWVVVTGVLDVTQSSWYHRGVQRVTAALEQKLGKVCGSFGSEIEALSPAFAKDDVKIQMDETRARRKLAKEVRRPKSPTGGIKVVWHQGRKI